MKNHQLNVKLESMAFHRNGICGESFFVVLFNDLDEKRKMVATVFSSSVSKHCDDEGNPRCAVYDIAQLCEGNIGFAQGNSWRGDRYFSALLPQMRKHWKEKHGYELDE